MTASAMSQIVGGVILSAGRSSRMLGVVSCDGPFLPANLVARLNNKMEAQDADVAVVSYAGEWQPTFSVWYHRMSAQIGAAIKQKRGIGLKTMARERKTAVLEWPLEVPSPFFNINNPEDLRQAEELL